MSRHLVIITLEKHWEKPDSQKIASNGQVPFMVADVSKLGDYLGKHGQNKRHMETLSIDSFKINFPVRAKRIIKGMKHYSAKNNPFVATKRISKHSDKCSYRFTCPDTKEEALITTYGRTEGSEQTKVSINGPAANKAYHMLKDAIRCQASLPLITAYDLNINMTIDDTFLASLQSLYNTLQFNHFNGEGNNRLSVFTIYGKYPDQFILEATRRGAISILNKNELDKVLNETTFGHKNIHPLLVNPSNKLITLKDLDQTKVDTDEVVSVYMNTASVKHQVTDTHVEDDFGVESRYSWNCNLLIMEDVIERITAYERALSKHPEFISTLFNNYFQFRTTKIRHGVPCARIFPDHKSLRPALNEHIPSSVLSAFSGLMGVLWCLEPFSSILNSNNNVFNMDTAKQIKGILTDKDQFQKQVTGHLCRMSDSDFEELRQTLVEIRSSHIIENMEKARHQVKTISPTLRNIIRQLSPKTQEVVSYDVEQKKLRKIFGYQKKNPKQYQIKTEFRNHVLGRNKQIDLTGMINTMKPLDEDTICRAIISTSRWTTQSTNAIFKSVNVNTVIPLVNMKLYAHAMTTGRSSLGTANLSEVLKQDSSKINEFQRFRVHGRIMSNSIVNTGYGDDDLCSSTEAYVDPVLKQVHEERFADHVEDPFHSQRAYGLVRMAYTIVTESMKKEDVLKFFASMDNANVFLSLVVDQVKNVDSRLGDFTYKGMWGNFPVEDGDFGGAVRFNRNKAQYLLNKSEFNSVVDSFLTMFENAGITNVVNADLYNLVADLPDDDFAHQRRETTKKLFDYLLWNIMAINTDKTEHFKMLETIDTWLFDEEYVNDDNQIRFMLLRHKSINKLSDDEVWMPIGSAISAIASTMKDDPPS